MPDPFFYVTINQLVRYALFSLLKEIKKKKSERQRERGGGRFLRDADRLIAIFK